MSSHFVNVYAEAQGTKLTCSTTTLGWGTTEPPTGPARSGRTAPPAVSPRSLPWPAMSRWVLGSGGDTPWTPGCPAGRHPAPRAHVRFSIADMLRRVRHACTRTWTCQPPPVPILNVPIKAHLWRSLSTVVQVECLYSHFMKTPNLCGPRSRLYDECVG